MKKSTRKPVSPQPHRPPPLHQGTLDEAVARLGLRGVTTRRMFGGSCYYAENKPFAILLGADLALKLPAAQLRDGCGSGDGRVFNPGGGDFFMREYLALSEQALADETRIDTYVLTSYRFIAAQKQRNDEGLTYEDLMRGREKLYKEKQ